MNEKLYVNISFSYRKPTEFGYAHCSSYQSVIDEVRDIDNVENMVALMKKFFSKKDLNGKEVRLSYSTLNVTERFHDVALICEEYNGYDLYIYEGRGAYTNKHADKMTKKDFKEFYLNCADCAIAYKEEKDRKAAEVGA